MPDLPPFHLAIPVDDLAAARGFYGGLLGCPEGRSSPRWVDFDLYGHQLVAHLVENAAHPDSSRAPDAADAADAGSNPVDNHAVPVPHFGAVLEWNAWHALAERLRAAGTAFVIEPYVRFAGQVGEQATLFLRDPSGNALEFKAFRDPAQLFAK